MTHETGRQDPTGVRIGDKVRVRFGPFAGQRAVVRCVEEGRLELQLETGAAACVAPDEITNYSLAARRAWQAMPKRAGRPPMLPGTRKRMVSIRLDEDVWRRLGRAAEFGLIPSREQAVNLWLREQLDALFCQEALSGTLPVQSPVPAGRETCG
jgi:uncharacterized protein (DUF4415 family)